MVRRVAVLVLPLLIAALVGSFGPSAGAVGTPPPGFHADVDVQSTLGPSESYVGIAFPGPAMPAGRGGKRVLAWQAGARYNESLDGVNWGPATIPGTSGGGDVDSKFDAFGASYIVEFCTATQGELQACLHKSTDGGTTWTTSTIANVAPNPIDRPWIDVYPKYRPTATITNTTQVRVYLEYHTFSDGQVWVNTSTNGGTSFGPPVPVGVGTNAAVADSNCNTVPSGVAVDQQNGTAYAAWLSGNDVAVNAVTGCNYTQIGPFNKNWVSKSANDGLTWTPKLAWTGAYDVTTQRGDNANKLFGALDVDRSGQVQVLMSVRLNDDPLHYVINCQNPLGTCAEAPVNTENLLLTSPDAGAHWTPPKSVGLVTATPHSYFYAWPSAGAKGVVDAVYYYADTNLPNQASDVWYQKFSQISGAIANAPGVAGCPADNITMTGPACYVGAGPTVAQETLLNPGSIHNGGICTFGIFCDVIEIAGGNADRSLLDTNNVQLDPAGGANSDWTANSPGVQRIEFACQNSGRSAFDGVANPYYEAEPFAGGAPILNGCYGPTDMGLAKTAPATVNQGGQMTYHLTVTNNGTVAMPATTSSVLLTDTLPAGTTFVSATPQWAGETCTNAVQVVTCKLGIFPSGTSATVDILVNVSPTAVGILHNTAAVGAGTTDPTAANNTASADTTVLTASPSPTISPTISPTSSSLCTITGTNAGETIRGTAGNDTICALGGNDTVFGNGGNDTIFGGEGNDVLYGNAGSDSIYGENGGDTIVPGPDNDPFVDGGAGTNGVNYQDATSGVTVHLDTNPQTATGGSGTDTLFGISNIGGSQFADDLTGSSGKNDIDGRGGVDSLKGLGNNDVLIGGAATDTLDGGSGTDTADYYTAPAGATVNLGTNSTSNDGYGTADTLSSIEDAKGSNAGGDSLTGSGVANKLYGFGGNDALDGSGASDFCDGGAGGGDTAANCETTAGIP